MSAAPPCLLALDCATETVHLGLAAHGRTWVRSLPGGAQASAGLLPALRSMLDEAGLDWHHFDALAFGRGPGAFTGLRTAAAVVQGLAFGAARPVIALDTLLAVAEDAVQRNGLGTQPVTIWAATDARMGELYAAAYRRDAHGHWQTEQPPALWQPDALATHLREEQARLGTIDGQSLTVAGNALRIHPELVPHGSARFPDAVPAGNALLALAHIAFLQGHAADPALALPLYVRDQVALTTAEREAAAAARALASQEAHP